MIFTMFFYFLLLLFLISLSRLIPRLLLLNENFAIDQENVEYWLHNLEQHGSADVQRILIGNKADLPEAQRRVEHQRG